MYLNVNGNHQVGMNGGQTYNMEDGSCTTPEIINSLMTMSNPHGPIPQNCQPLSPKDSHQLNNSYENSQYCNMNQQVHKLTKKEVNEEQHCYNNNHHSVTTLSNINHSINDLDQQNCYADQSSPSNFSSESFGSPCASPSSSTGVCSIQTTRSHLIKESLKVTIQSKRLANGQILPNVDSRGSFHDELTPEDEDRRKRRRERNKVAATKCRNKKKERTVHLMMESDTLEQTNHSLRTEIQRLEGEKQRLLDMLTYHMPACSMQSINQGNYYNSVNNNSVSIMGQ